MSLILKSNVASLRNMGSVSGLIGPQDYSLMADLSSQRYTVGGESLGFNQLFNFSRASNAWRVDEDREVQTYAPNEPVFDTTDGKWGLVMEPSSTGNSYATGSNPESYTSSVVSSTTPFRVRVWGEGSLQIDRLSGGSSLESVTVREADGYVAFSLHSGQQAQFTVSNLELIQMSSNGLATRFIPRDGGAVPRAFDRLTLLPQRLGYFSGSFTMLVNYIVDKTTVRTGGPLYVFSLNNASGPVVQASLEGACTLSASYGSATVQKTAAYEGTLIVAVDRQAGTLKLSAGDEVVSAQLQLGFDVTELYLGSHASAASLSGLIRKAVIFERALSDDEFNVAKNSFL